MKEEKKIILGSVSDNEKSFDGSQIAKDLTSLGEESLSSSDNADSNPPLKRSETLEGKLWKFKKESSGIISEIRKREAYDKPSVKRKKKSKEARRRKKTGRYHNNYR